MLSTAGLMNDRKIMLIMSKNFSSLEASQNYNKI
jgi:hypothetical protein